MSSPAASPAVDSSASGHYSKRKRVPITYVADELASPDSDYEVEAEAEAPPPKKSQGKAKATTTPKVSKRTIFPFLQLPAEIRNIIYTYSLVDLHGIKLKAVNEKHRHSTARILPDGAHGGAMLRANERLSELSPALLAVCKQIHWEGRDMLYGNEFVFVDTRALYAFLISLGPVGARYLKTLRVHRWGRTSTLTGYSHACFTALVCAVNLITFQIDDRISDAMTISGSAKQFYHDAFPWLEAVGSAKQQASAAVEILKFGRDGPVRAQPQGPEQAGKDFKVELTKHLVAQQNKLRGNVPKQRRLSQHVAVAGDSS
ncbi:hypothetical protein T440DRAFT_489127 [Plenodomus tracheiphilus IPT5]|uniref:F-box domain-containing protein n=1 Tax=Plenodomus tracheiphilus IPT5 TaxID=1408161 RepID=A0A6A7B835_9PLEO|nr:hypothetical protein T440DRAFT_489127 [Plenodomus tracheiphilus IPT5]